MSALCDADKGLPVVDPGIRAIVPDVRMAGPALTVVAQDDHLPVFSALDAAEPGDVLVVVNGGGSRAVVGELFATEAKRRGLAGIVVDGLCRDVAGLRRLGLPFFARGTVPASGSTVSRAALRQRVRCGGVDVGRRRRRVRRRRRARDRPARPPAAALEGGEAIARAERAMLAAMAEGRPLHDLTSYAEHVAALDERARERAGVPCRLRPRVPWYGCPHSFERTDESPGTPGSCLRDLESQRQGDRNVRHDDRSRWISLVVLCVGVLMIVLDATVVNVALPSIQSDLGFSQSSLAWVVNAYLIAFGGLLLLAGRLGDLIGRRTVFLAGLAVFTARVAAVRRSRRARRCWSPRASSRASPAR